MYPVGTDFTSEITGNATKPIVRVTTYDTPLSVPSVGLECMYYTFTGDLVSYGARWWDNANVTLQQYGHEPSPGILSFDWGDGAPPVIPSAERYCAKWYGYFFARYTGLPPRHQRQQSLK